MPQDQGPTKNARLDVRMSESLLYRIKAAAAERGETVSEIARRQLDQVARRTLQDDAA